MKTLDLTLSDARGKTPLPFPARRMINLGYVGRNQAAVRAHIEELAHEGVPPPPAVPLVMAIPLHVLSMEDTIEVVGAKTSGEAEAVFLLADGKIYVGIGSDHTDRELERHSIIASKLTSPNVLGREVWDFADLEARWDDLVLQSFAGAANPGAAPYQRAPLGSLLPSRTLLECALARLPKSQHDGLVIFAGTVPVQGGFRYGGPFRAELLDAGRSRKLNCAYGVRVLEDLTGGPALG